MEKTTFWICDKCGQKIESVKDGWVEWMTLSGVPPFEGPRCKNIRIVHRVKCIYTNEEAMRNHAIPADLDLEFFSTPDGLMRLLQMISDNEFENKEDVLEIIKRIHIPGYEAARHFFEEAIYNGVFEPNTKPNYYWQRDIQDTIEFARKNGLDA